MKQLKRDISKGKLEQVYLFIGSETFLMKEIIDLMRASLDDPSSINYANFKGEEIWDLRQADDFISLCMTLPFISSRRLVVLHNMHKIPISIMDKVLELLRKLPESTTLVLTIEEPKQTKGLADKVTALSRILPNLKIKRFDRLTGKSLIDWIMDRVSSYGRKIESDAASLLSDVTDSNTWLIATEIEKLCMYTPGNAPITKSDVEDAVMQTKEASIFKYMDNLFDRRADAVYRLFELERNGVEPMIVVNMLEKKIISHYQVFKDMDPSSKGSKTRIKGEWKIRPRISLWSLGELLQLLGDVRKLETKIKTGKSVHIYANLAEISSRYVIRRQATMGRHRV